MHRRMVPRSAAKAMYTRSRIEHHCVRMLIPWTSVAAAGPGLRQGQGCFAAAPLCHATPPFRQPQAAALACTPYSAGKHAPARPVCLRPTAQCPVALFCQQHRDLRLAPINRHGTRGWPCTRCRAMGGEGLGRQGQVRRSVAHGVMCRAKGVWRRLQRWRPRVPVCGMWPSRR